MGCGESGKSTVLKQWRNQFGHGFDESEILQYKMLIMGNAIQGISMILKLCEVSNLFMENPKNVEFQKVIYDYELEIGLKQE